ncbi:MAG TPA: NAD-binding protein, partial [Usitatibacter sp.]
EVLVAAALSRAVAVVVSFADTRKALAILAHVRELRPDIPVIVRTFDDSDVETLRQAGAAEIVAEVVEGSLMLGTQTMIQLGMPLNRVLRRLREIREERYRYTPGFFHGITDTDVDDRDEPRLRTVVVGPDAPSAGRTLADLGLDAVDVKVTAVRRKGSRDIDPAADTPVHVGDVLVLLGTQENLARAEMRILQG